MLGLVREKFGMDTWAVQANAAKLPFEDAAFDLVVSLNFLHLFPNVNDKTALVSEMGRIVKPGGVLIVEFDNALQGLMLGPMRKYFGKDIGYDWPWDIRSCFRNERFTRVEVQGASLPFVWRIPIARSLDNFTGAFPLNYLATKIFVTSVSALNVLAPVRRILTRLPDSSDRPSQFAKCALIPQFVGDTR